MRAKPKTNDQRWPSNRIRVTSGWGLRSSRLGEEATGGRLGRPIPTQNIGRRLSGNEDFLRDKAKLLIARERELLTLKRKHKRLALWLALAQRLPQLVDPKSELEET